MNIPKVRMTRVHSRVSGKKQMACTSARLGTPRGLQIELGRWTNPKTPRCNRNCPAGCSGAEDLYHLTMVCPIAAEHRAVFLAKVADIIRTDGADYLDWRAMSPVERYNLLLGDGPQPCAPRIVIEQWWKVQFRYYKLVQRAYENRARACC